jgi:Domain of unknown function (DUF3598)
MNLQDKNWENLFGCITPSGVAWHGIWTKYSPDKNILESFKSIRKLQANEEKTLITHTNYYIYSDGRELEKSWQIEKQICSQPDGVIHPAASSMRAISFGEGKTVWFSKKLEAGQKLGAELFFQHQDWRTSVAIIYTEKGDLERITLIRDHLNSFPDKLPKAEIEKLSGKWNGRKECIDSNLQRFTLAENQELVLEATSTNKMIFLPDNITVNTPQKVNIGKEFEIVSSKLVTEHTYQRLTAKYNNYGAFTMLISEVFKQEY